MRWRNVDTSGRDNQVNPSQRKEYAVVLVANTSRSGQRSDEIALSSTSMTNWIYLQTSLYYSPGKTSRADVLLKLARILMSWFYWNPPGSSGTHLVLLLVHLCSLLWDFSTGLMTSRVVSLKASFHPSSNPEMTSKHMLDGSSLPSFEWENLYEFRFPWFHNKTAASST